MVSSVSFSKPAVLLLAYGGPDSLDDIPDVTAYPSISYMNSSSGSSSQVVSTGLTRSRTVDNMVPLWDAQQQQQ